MAPSDIKKSFYFVSLMVDMNFTEAGVYVGFHRLLCLFKYHIPMVEEGYVP